MERVFASHLKIVIVISQNNTIIKDPKEEMKKVKFSKLITLLDRTN